MTKTYRISEHGSLLHNGEMLQPGTPLPTDFPSKLIPDQLKRGTIVEDRPTTPEPQRPSGNGTAAGKWNVDPSTLQGKTLEQLNLMILDIDGKAPAMPTVQEAIGWLSRDFKKGR